MSKSITQHLVIDSIEANNWKYDDNDNEITTAWAVWFTFFGRDSFYAIITDDKINLEHASYGYIESPLADLHDSFSEQIESHWSVIVNEVKEWEKQNTVSQL